MPRSFEPTGLRLNLERTWRGIFGLVGLLKLPCRPSKEIGQGAGRDQEIERLVCFPSQACGLTKISPTPAMSSRDSFRLLKAENCFLTPVYQSHPQLEHLLLKYIASC